MLAAGLSNLYSLLSTRKLQLQCQQTMATASCLPRWNSATRKLLVSCLAWWWKLCTWHSPIYCCHSPTAWWGLGRQPYAGLYSQMASVTPRFFGSPATSELSEWMFSEAGLMYMTRWNCLLSELVGRCRFSSGIILNLNDLYELNLANLNGI